MRGLDTDRTTKDSAFNGTQTLTEHLTAQDWLRSRPQVSIRRLVAGLPGVRTFKIISIAGAALAGSLDGQICELYDAVFPDLLR
jgi:hypothetical protein